MCHDPSGAADSDLVARIYLRVDGKGKPLHVLND
jgi:hypothetical protein